MVNMVVSKKGLSFCIKEPDSRYMEMGLKKKQMISVCSNHPLFSIHCLDGFLWVTQSGDNADTILEPGQIFNVTHPGKVLIQGITAGKVSITPVK